MPVLSTKAKAKSITTAVLLVKLVPILVKTNEDEAKATTPGFAASLNDIAGVLVAVPDRQDE